MTLLLGGSWRKLGSFSAVAVLESAAFSRNVFGDYHTGKVENYGRAVDTSNPLEDSTCRVQPFSFPVTSSIT